MSTEFIVLASLTVASFASNIVVLFLFLFLTRRRGNEQANRPYTNQSFEANNQAGLFGQPAGVAETGIVFCRNCGNQFDSTFPVCPSCKTPH